MVDDEIYARLTTHAGIVALVSQRVYADILPQNPMYPAACVYAGVSLVPSFVSIDNMIHTHEERVQVSCYAETRAESRALAKQVRQALHGYSADVIKDCQFQSESVFPEPGNGPMGNVLYHTPVDFIVTY